MTGADNKQLVRRYLETAFAQKDLDGASEMISANYCLHDPLRPNFAGGRDAFKNAHKAYIKGVRDRSFTINDQIAEGDKVVTRWTVEGCQSRDLPGIPSKGQCFKVGGITISRLADGQIVEEWQDWDGMGLARQLGSA